MTQPLVIVVQCNLDYLDLKQNLNFLDLLETSKHFSMHVQRVWPMIFWGVWQQLSDADLQTCLGQN